jgi:hypothetical protein
MPRALRALGTSASFLLFAAATALTIHAGYFRMFSFFAPWDDEGYMLVMLRSFRAIGALYTEVYSQYGPVYFLVMDLLFDGLRLPVTHDTGRLVTLGVWAASSLVCGLAAWRLTRSVGLGLCTQLLAFRSLYVQHFEPMHPGGLLCLLLSSLALVPLVYDSRPRLAAVLLGVGVAAVVLVKINVGVFALLATGFFYVGSVPALARRRPLLIGAGVAIAAAPLVLIWPALQHPWAQRYVLHVATAAIGVAVAIGATGPDARFRLQHLGWWAAGAAGLALLVGSAVILRGTRPGDLFDAVLIRPLGQAAALTIPMRIPPNGRILDLLALALCVGAVRSRGRWSDHGTDLVEGPLRIATGLAMALTASGLSLTTGLFTIGNGGFLMAPFAWVAALGPRGIESPGALAVARRFLPPLAVLQTLVAYPVAGLTQVQWSSFLLIPVGAICVADGARQLGRSVRPLATPGWAPRLAGAVAVLVLLAITVRGVRIQMRSERALYESNRPLGLPGAARLRIPSAEAAPLRAVVADLRQRCSTHIGLPGVNSFYLWAGQEPPTAANAGTWMYLFEAPLQARIVERLRGIDRLCGVSSVSLAAMYSRGRPIPPRPLAEYFETAFRPAAEYGPFTVLVRR